PEHAARHRRRARSNRSRRGPIRFDDARHPPVRSRQTPRHRPRERAGEGGTPRVDAGEVSMHTLALAATSRSRPPQSHHIPAAASPFLQANHATSGTSIDCIAIAKETMMETKDTGKNEYTPRGYSLERWIVTLLSLLFFL